MNRSSVHHNQDGISKWETPRLADGLSSKKNAQPEKTLEQIQLDAYAEGHTAGYQAGITQANEEIQKRIQILENFVQSLNQPFQDQNHHIAEELAQLAGKIAKSLVRRELRTEPETIMALVRDTVSTLNSTKYKVKIHLNPTNAKIIRDIVNVESLELNWNIIDDPLISRSDCKISSNDSLIDADLETRINLIITQFLGDERSENRS